MIPSFKGEFKGAKPSPRTRGDDPILDLLLLNVEGFSPHPRG